MREVSKKSDGVSKKIHTHTLFEIREIHDFSLLKLLDSLLDLGESEAIVLALERKSKLIIDEKKGRKIAMVQGLDIIGLLGIVYLNIRQQYLTPEEARAFLQEALEHGYRISPKLIETMFAKL
jgi:predicted nucleic acid-binding protein